MSDNDAVVHRFVRVCFSVHSTYFEWSIYILEGVLLCFGAFLSFETRHVSSFFFETRHVSSLVFLSISRHKRLSRLYSEEAGNRQS